MTRERFSEIQAIRRKFPVPTEGVGFERLQCVDELIKFVEATLNKSEDREKQVAEILSKPMPTAVRRFFGEPSRAEIAMRLMAGIYTNQSAEFIKAKPDMCASIAVEGADALLIELQKK